MSNAVDKQWGPYFNHGAVFRPCLLPEPDVVFSSRLPPEIGLMVMAAVSRRDVGEPEGAVRMLHKARVQLEDEFPDHWTAAVEAQLELSTGDALAAAERHSDAMASYLDALQAMDRVGTSDPDHHLLLGSVLARVGASAVLDRHEWIALGVRHDRVPVQQLHLLPPEAVRELAVYAHQRGCVFASETGPEEATLLLRFLLRDKLHQ